MITENIQKKLQTLLPGGVNSPVRSFKSVSTNPLIVHSAKGSRFLDVEGRSYLDFCTSWGALIHGHAHLEIVRVLQQAAEKGTTYGLTCEAEEKLAEKVVCLIPSIEKVRFVSSGTEATMSAIRLARGYTKRDLIVKFTGCYHGHADHLLVKGGSGLIAMAKNASSAGVPEDFVKHTASLPFNDSETIKAFLRNNAVAAVIVEPVAGNMGVVPADIEFLQTLRTETEKTGALLIFDEVITGFRVSSGGAQKIYGIYPDLTCLGKIVGGGLPVGAFGGRKEIMDYLAPIGPVYQAGTLSGNPLAMEAGYQTLCMLSEEGFYDKLEEKTCRFVSPIIQMIKEENLPLSLQRVGSMLTLFFGVRSVKGFNDAKKADTKAFAKFFQEMLKEGIYLPPSQHESWFISSAHEEKDLDKAQKAILRLLLSKTFM